MTRPKIFSIFILSLISVFWAGSVSAHATPVTYQPEASAVLAEASSVVIRFTERIDAAGSNISVFGPDGKIADNGQPRVSESDRRIFSVDLLSKESGTYTVSWQVVSADDGHFTRGGYSFSVGNVTAPAISIQSEVVFSSRIGDGVATGVELVGQGILWALLVLVVRGKGNWGNQGDKGRKMVSWLTLSGVGLVVLGTVLYIIVKSQDLSLLRSVDFSSALKIFMATAAGKFALARLGLSLLFLLVFGAARKKILSSLKITRAEEIMFLILVFMALARVASSHAAAAHFLPAFTWVDHLIHMLSKGLWAGLAVVVSLLVWPLVFKTGKLNEVFRIHHRLSKLFIIIFATVGVTGAYIVWLDLKTGGNILTTEWGTRFIILSLFGGVLMGLRLMGQLYVQWEFFHSVKKAVTVLKITSTLEAIAGIGLLAATGFIMITTPPVWNKNVFEAKLETQGSVVRVQEHPTETSFLKISADIPEVKNLVVTLTNEEKGIGPIVAEHEQRSNNTFVISKNQLSVPGKWKMGITMVQPEGYDLTGDVNFNFPTDVDAGRLEQGQRTFGWFEIIVLANALGALALAVLLWWVNKYFGKKYELEIAPKNLEIPENNVGVPKIVTAGLVLVILLTALWVTVPVVAKSSFQRACEKSGNAWHTMVPTRNSVPISETSSVGCMLGTGQFHISDWAEYKYFTQAVNPQVALDFGTQPLLAGQPTDFKVSIRDEAGQPLKNISIQHERILHTIIISDNFKVFSHIHTEDQGTVTTQSKQSGDFPLSYKFPAAGKYLIAVDFAVNAQSFSRQFLVDVGGDWRITSSGEQDFSAVKNFNGYEVSLSVPEGFITPGQLATLRYKISKASQPVTDLQPYLGAAMHLAIVKDDLSKFLHTHGEVHLPGQPTLPVSGHFHPLPPASFGPDVEAHVDFMEAGIYHIFGEFKHNSQVIPIQFTVEVK